MKAIACRLEPAAILTALLLTSLALAYEPVGRDGKPCHITRGIYCPAGPLLSTAFWGKFGEGFEFTTGAAHTGRACARVSVQDAGGRGMGVAQTIRLQQEKPEPVKIAGWSKAEGVADGPRDYRYSIYLDLTYTDGTPLQMQIATFSPGTHDWEYSETIIKPEKPLASARVYAFLRQRTGTAYFDDLFVGPVDGPNLLKNPGFEPDDRDDRAAQAAVYDTYAALHANAIHTYMSGSPAFWQGEDGKGNAEVRRFLADAKARNMGVWLTTGEPGQPPIKDANDPNFPEYLCVNGAWGEAWTETLRLAAAYDFAGLSLVPDEYNWTNAPLRERYAKHPDAKVAEFYQHLPAMCNCPVCAALYEKTYGEKLPPLAEGMSFPEPTLPHLKYLRQRYDSTARWMGRSVAAIKSVNPKVRADSLICVSPICSDIWWGTGVAWDRMGAISNVDFPTTDPYILLHNYLGDSTHWYVTETAAHLTGSTAKRQCGIVLEASRLRKEYRELDPVEVYGSALSAVAHGATELAWWHYSHLTDQSRTTDHADVSRACVSGVYGLLEQADPWLGGLHTPPLVAYLHSRTSDDMWRFYATKPEPGKTDLLPTEDARYAAVAQKEVLYYLFRRGVPVDLYYLETAQERQLAPYRTIIVPFPFAIADTQVALLRKLAAAGKTVIITSQVGALDEIGQRRDTPALLDLCGLTALPAEDTTHHVQQVGKGRAVFLGDAYAHGLPLNRDNQKRTRAERILPDPLNMERTGVLDETLKQACGCEPWALGDMTGKDVEARSLINAAGEPVLLAINWENEPQTVALRVPLTKTTLFTGFRLGPGGKLTPSSIKGQAAGESVRFKLTLRPQEACLWRGGK